jgi:HAD superfamily hydrolase (TIGR01484 family)
MYKVVAFDLDGTLTESKQQIDDRTARFLAKLALEYEVAIITGGTMKQIETQVLQNLPDGIENKLHLMSCSGAIYEKFGVLQYKYDIPKIQREVIASIVKVTAESLGLWETNTLGDVIEDREAQITFSALGQKAKLEDKKVWDETGSKRKSMVEALKKSLPDFSIRSGGLSSVDISQEGIDKEFALKQLMKINNLDASEILYIGDKFRPGENDYPALVAGVTCLRVIRPEDTIGITERMLKQPHLRYIW